MVFIVAPIVCVFFCVFGPCFVVQCFGSFLVLWSSRWGRESWLLYFITFLMPCGCYCSLSLPHGAVVWSVVCGCDISWSYSIFEHLVLIVGNRTSGRKCRPRCDSFQCCLSVLPRRTDALSILAPTLNCLPPSLLTLKASITTAADDQFCYIFPNFRKK